MGSRRIEIFTVTTPGRDEGKAFRIEEMSAWDGERWAVRAFHEVSRAGGDLEEYSPGAGWERLALAGFQAFNQLDLAVAQPLWDQLLTCVTRVEDPGRPEVFRPLVESDIDEIATIVQLKFRAFQIHANFSQAGGSQKSTPPASTTTRAQSSASTQTSPPSSGPSFHQARRAPRTSAR